MRTPDDDVAAVLRYALGRAGLVAGYDHVCRRCKARGVEEHAWHFTDAAQRRCEACGMLLWPRAVARGIRFHDLRHSCATILLRAGVGMHIVQRILRHTDIRTTIGTYTHMELGDLRAGFTKVYGEAPPIKRTAAFGTGGQARAESLDSPIGGFFNKPVFQEEFGRAMRDSNPRPLASEANALSI